MSHNNTTSFLKDILEIGSRAEKIKSEYSNNNEEMNITDYNKALDHGTNIMTAAVKKILDECEFYGEDSIVNGRELDFDFFIDVLDNARINIEEEL